MIGISTYGIKINGTKCEVCICMYCEYSFQSKLKDNHKFIQAVPPNSVILVYSLICNGTKKDVWAGSYYISGAKLGYENKK